MTRNHSQNGSAFFIILIAIAMFAALSFAIMQTSRTSTATLGKEQARLAAQEIVSYTGAIVKAVHKLRLAGCSDTQIGFDFDDSPGWWTSNPLSPADGSCQVFGMSGGKISFKPINVEWFAQSSATPYGYPNGEIAIQNIGTAAPELTFSVADLKWEICEEINKLIPIETSTFVESLTTPTGVFAGTYVALPDGLGDDVGSPFAGKSSACAKNVNGDGTYVTTLIAR